MKSNSQGISKSLRSISIVSFLALGGYWGVAALLREGTPLLVIPAFLCIITGLLLNSRLRPDITRILVISTGLYNISLAAYQVYASSSSIFTGLLAFSAVITVANLAIIIIFTVILLSMHSNESAIIQYSDQSSGVRKVNKS